MYHIKDDRRVRTSARLICEGLDRCLEHKPFDKVTVSDVQRESTVGRATFYRLFDTLPDVLAYQCDTAMTQVLDRTQALPGDRHAKSLCFLRGMMDHADLLDTIVRSGHVEILYQAHVRNEEALVRGFFRSGQMDAAEAEYMMGILTYVMLGVLVTWVKRGRRETAEDLYDIMDKALFGAAGA